MINQADLKRRIQYQLPLKERISRSRKETAAWFLWYTPAVKKANAFLFKEIAKKIARKKSGSRCFWGLYREEAGDLYKFNKEKGIKCQ